MLVALVVLSLSLGVLYQAAMGATRNVRVATEYTGAVMLAESVLTEYSYVTDENLAMTGRSVAGLSRGMTRLNLSNLQRHHRRFNI